MAKIVDKL